MTLTAVQTKIVDILERTVVPAKELAKMLGKGYDEFKVQSMVLTLARKGQVDKVKAALILQGTVMSKFLNYETGSQLKGGIPKGKRR